MLSSLVLGSLLLVTEVLQIHPTRSLIKQLKTDVLLSLEEHSKEPLTKPLLFGIEILRVTDFRIVLRNSKESFWSQ